MIIQIGKVEDDKKDINYPGPGRYPNVYENKDYGIVWGLSQYLKANKVGNLLRWDIQMHYGLHNIDRSMNHDFRQRNFAITTGITLSR